MTTSVTVNLSPTMSAALNSAGINAYAVYFETSATTPGQTSTTVSSVQIAGLVGGGQVVNSAVTLTLPSPYSGGKVYFIIQSGQCRHRTSRHGSRPCHSSRSGATLLLLSGTSASGAILDVGAIEIIGPGHQPPGASFTVSSGDTLAVAPQSPHMKSFSDLRPS
jgi:hypothetical protein